MALVYLVCMMVCVHVRVCVCVCKRECQYQLTGQICSSLRSCGFSHGNVECDSVCEHENACE